MSAQAQIRADIVKNYLPWNKVAPELVKLQRMTGITNATYKAEIEGDPQPIIYRKFGESEENLFLSRLEETHVYAQMSASGDGPKIYYYDEKIRLQEFIDSSVLLAKNMLTPGYLEGVAYTLAQFHKSKPKAPEISKYSLFRKSFLNAKEKMLHICQNKLAKDIYTPQEKPIVQLLKTWVTSEELSFLQKLISKYEASWELVFSHNDLLCNNVLIRKDNGRFLFIDFEYATFNFPFYDIANYFEESLISYECQQPPFYTFVEPHPETEKYKLRFLDAYVVAKDYSLEEFNNNFEALRNLPKYVEQRQKLAKALGVGRLLCSLMWGWWSIIVSKNPQINFDYIKFAKWRYENYHFEKKAVNLQFD